MRMIFKIVVELKNGKTYTFNNIVSFNILNKVELQGMMSNNKWLFKWENIKLITIEDATFRK